MESSIVIKVKYGETLRRFNASVDESGKLDLDMHGLRERILGLFSFASDADLILTYIDEDGDVVTLADEEDLYDVVRQSLNPLRITVKLIAEKGGRFYARSSGNSTPMRSPRVPHPLQNMNSSLSDIMKSMPDPFHEALSKLPLDLASKAAFSNPLIAELVERFSKMGQSPKNPVSESQAGSESTKASGASGNVMAASVVKKPEASNNEQATSVVMPNAKFGEPTYESNQKVDLEKGTRVVEASGAPTSGLVNLNSNFPGGSALSGCAPANPAPVASSDAVYDPNDLNKFAGRHTHRMSNNSGWWSSKSIALACNNEERKKANDLLKTVGAVASASTPDSMTQKDTNLDGSSSSALLDKPVKKGFGGMQMGRGHSAVPSLFYGPRVPPFKRSYNQSDGMGSIFHRGVRCDGCGVHPITGPRFKSKVKEDYDLCSICFSEMGNEADYLKLERPLSHRHPYYYNDSMQNPLMNPPTLQHFVRGHPMKPRRPKLDSRFIVDVNVLDGTTLAPSTPFTKIWRMLNNGTTVWPEGTQLVWIGGDRLTNAFTFELQTFTDGVPVGKELDIAADFTAPERPGRYISYWRMASPSGQKFGQRVWVLIQVDASLNELVISNHGLNLNLPPESSGLTGPEMVNGSVEPMAVDCSLPELEKSGMASDLVEPIVDAHPNEEQELNFPINDSLLVGGGVSNPFTPEVPHGSTSLLGGGVSSPFTPEVPRASVSDLIPPKVSTKVSYPIVDLSEVEAPALLSHVEQSPSTEVPAAAQASSENNDVEQSLLRELEEMGFKQVDLNKEILRRNEYDLEQSVDDLCGVSEWDPMLEELQDMGFRDDEMNKRLLMKNNGSIKRVVMDLIAGEKE